MKRLACLLAGLLALAGVARAQDTVPVDRGVRVGITYTPGLRPGLLVLGGAHDEMLDSARAILQRDLDYSDRFELISLPGGDSLTIGVGTTRPGTQTDASYVNYPLYDALGATYAV